jgi:uncharacterized protein YbjT (DUF2867 family)
MSCLASRTGNPKDAWAIDHAAHMLALQVAQDAGVKHFVLLSAICVQKPLLTFQHAKLAFEDALVKSGMRYAIVRPTAFFKSLCGQIDRVRKGKPFLLFGDGQLTACKPISDQDLGNYLAQCVSDPALHNRILPIGGPGPAITPFTETSSQRPSVDSVTMAVPAGLPVASTKSATAAAFVPPETLGTHPATRSALRGRLIKNILFIQKSPWHRALNSFGHILPILKTVYA